MPVASVVIEGAPAAAGILRAADQNAADLIMLTSHGRGRLPNLIMGSVTDKVVRASTLPVLVVRRQSLESELPREPEFSLYESTHPTHTELIAARDQERPTPKRRRKEHLSVSPQGRAKVRWRYWA